MNKDFRKFGGKNFGELKSICIGNVMEIVKIGKKTWRIAVICQSIFTANVFYCTVVGMFGGDEAIGASVLTSTLLEILTLV